MSINYAKHEEEFYGVFKLISGEEVLGRSVLTEDQGESLVFIQDPVVVQLIDKPVEDQKVSPTGEYKIARAIGFTKWQQLSDEDFYIIREKDIVTISSMNKEVIFMYEAFIHGADGLGEKKSKMRTELNKTRGFIGKIDEARKRFEKLFKEDPKSP
tara:strand:+ start:2938 stop:3405 length:468 start_codon:yes stop_codon:yes gene_type:complete